MGIYGEYLDNPELVGTLDAYKLYETVDSQIYKFLGPPAGAAPNPSRRLQSMTLKVTCNDCGEISRVQANLATRCRNTCRVASSTPGASFEQLTQVSPLQRRAFELLGL